MTRDLTTPVGSAEPIPGDSTRTVDRHVADTDVVPPHVSFFENPLRICLSGKNNTQNGYFWAKRAFSVRPSICRQLVTALNEAVARLADSTPAAGEVRIATIAKSDNNELRVSVFHDPPRVMLRAWHHLSASGKWVERAGFVIPVNLCADLIAKLCWALERVAVMVPADRCTAPAAEPDEKPAPSVRRDELKAAETIQGDLSPRHTSTSSP